MKPPNFDHLSTLIAVAESKNFQEAAEKLSISQPAVSFKLKELGSQMPLPIFQLVGKRKVLTRYGRSLYEIAKRQIGTIEKCIEDLERLYSSAENLTLRIAGRTEILDFIAPLLDFSGRIELNATDSQTAVSKLMSRDVDMAISYKLPDSTEVVAKRLFQSAAVFVIHEKFLGKRKLSLDLVKDNNFLRSNPCILYQNDGRILKDWLRHFDIFERELRIRYVAEDWRTVEQLVSKEEGFAIMPDYIKSSSNQVKRIELPSIILPKFTFYGIYQIGLKKIEAFKEVLEFKRIKSQSL